MRGAGLQRQEGRDMLVSSLYAATLRLAAILRESSAQHRSAVTGLLFVALSSVSVTAAETVFASRSEFEASLGAFRVFTFEPDQGFSGGLLPSFDEGRIQTRSQLGEYDGPASIIRYSSSANQVLVGNEVIGP